MPKIPSSSKYKPKVWKPKLSRQPTLAEVSNELDEIRLLMQNCTGRLADLTTKLMCFGLNTPKGELPPVDDLPF
ncbi:hypothetical protein M0R72_09330 [Candidatus Pacearchaeota archaeon]|nr:hypothetical protein [Candidatus Pacearchaeota archaeon]